MAHPIEAIGQRLRDETLCDIPRGVRVSQAWFRQRVDLRHLATVSRRCEDLQTRTGSKGVALPVGRPGPGTTSRIGVTGRHFVASRPESSMTWAFVV